jgi:hypothetical protein
MSPRTLDFCHNQVVFECYIGKRSSKRWLKFYLSRRTIFIIPFLPRKVNGLLAEQYPTINLTSETERLVAISGIEAVPRATVLSAIFLIRDSRNPIFYQKKAINLSNKEYVASYFSFSNTGKKPTNHANIPNPLQGLKGRREPWKLLATTLKALGLHENTKMAIHSSSPMFER